MYRRFFSIMIVLFIVINAAYAQESQWMPDPHLRMAVRQALKIDKDTPLTQGDMHRLLVLASNRVNISEELSDLTGLEYAVNLHSLLLGKHRVEDLRPLTNLVELRYLSFGGGPISDLTSLSGLVNLKTLTLWYNRIVDISPLANLTNLKQLRLSHNLIEDFSPLAGLVNLEVLTIDGNKSSDISEIPTSRLTEFNYDETCNIPGIPFSHRIAAREYPSVFGSWAYVVNKPPVILRPETSEIKPMAYFDLHFGGPETLTLGWSYGRSGERSVDGPKAVRLLAVAVSNIEKAKQRREAILAFNPDAILLVPILYYSGPAAWLYPEDGVLRDLYLRDKNGNRIGGEVVLLDFTLPETQEFVFDQVRAIAACGLFDGIFFDHWNKWERLPGRPQAEEHIARDRIIQGAREIIGDDMLILVNTGESKIPRWAEYINGSFMETHPIDGAKIEGTNKHHKLGYTREDLLDIEDTLVWSETHFREPRINSLWARGISTESPTSPRNKQWMRTFTTMSLTLSDGYVQYASPGVGKIYWYPFYDAPLGRPVGEKGQHYKNRDGVAIEGVFIREYTNGWAVYNRSGKEQNIYLPEMGSGVASGVEDKRLYTLPDLDGEIYLKSESGLEIPPTADINGDGVVNIQDLVIVANALGKTEPDLNGDGVVNIQDLVIVANAFE